MNVFGRTLEPDSLAAGMRCAREMWLRTRELHAPELVEGPDPRGSDRDTLITRLRVRYPDAVRVGARDGVDALRHTRDALDGGARAVFRGAIEYQGIIARPDLLVATNSRVWRVIRVDRALSPSTGAIRSLAAEVHILRHAGLEVTGARVIHLDRRSRHPDVAQVLCSTDVTATIEDLLADIPGELLRLKNLLYGPCPAAIVGPHCEGRRACPFRRRCAAEVPDDSLSLLHGAHGEFRDEWHARGVRSIVGLPSDLELDDIQARQRLAIRRRALVVSGDLDAETIRLRRPAAYVAIGVVTPAIPTWFGCRPLDAVPASIAVQLETDDRRHTHHDWMYDGRADPRPEAADRLLDWTHEKRSVVVYDRVATTRILRGLREALPDLAADLDALEERLVALRPRVERHLYHPRFRGSFELERVVAGMAPELRRNRLEVTDRAAADRALEALLARDPDLEIARRAAAFGRFEALALVHVARRLRALAEARQSAAGPPGTRHVVVRRRAPTPESTGD